VARKAHQTLFPFPIKTDPSLPKDCVRIESGGKSVVFRIVGEKLEYVSERKL